MAMGMAYFYVKVGVVVVQHFLLYTQHRAILRVVHTTSCDITIDVLILSGPFQ